MSLFYYVYNIKCLNTDKKIKNVEKRLYKTYVICYPYQEVGNGRQ